MGAGVITCALNRLKYYSGADVKYFIVRSPGRVNVKGMVNRPDLSPSSKLFYWTRQHKHEKSWFDEYAVQFRAEMRERDDLIAALTEVQEIAKTQTVLLVCFCADVNLCHRGLIADELKAWGVPVIRE